MENNRSALANAILVLVTLVGIFLIGFLIFGKPASAPFGPLFSAKATPDEILQMLKDGNERFSAGKSASPASRPDPHRLGRQVGPGRLCLRDRAFMLRFPGPGGADLRCRHHGPLRRPRGRQRLRHG